MKGILFPDPIHYADRNETYGVNDRHHDRVYQATKQQSDLRPQFIWYLKGSRR